MALKRAKSFVIENIYMLGICALIKTARRSAKKKLYERYELD